MKNSHIRLAHVTEKRNKTSARRTNIGGFDWFRVYNL